MRWCVQRVSNKGQPILWAKARQRLVPSRAQTSVFLNGEILPFFDKEVEKILDFFFPKCKFELFFF